jgi:hypothetical protein
MERVWTIITAVDGDNITATLDNQPIFIDAFYGDTIHFEKRHIYSICERSQNENKSAKDASVAISKTINFIDF